jgi:hypothetical protein
MSGYLARLLYAKQTVAIRCILPLSNPLIRLDVCAGPCEMLSRITSRCWLLTAGCWLRGGSGCFQFRMAPNSRSPQPHAAIDSPLSHTRLVASRPPVYCTDRRTQRKYPLATVHDARAFLVQMKPCLKHHSTRSGGGAFPKHCPVRHWLCAVEIGDFEKPSA